MEVFILSFQSMAAESAKVYLKFLKDNNKGISVISVKNIKQDMNHPELFSMVLENPPKAPDAMQIKINKHICKENEVRPVKYDKKSKTLIVRALSSFVDLLSQVDAKDITITSDISFLVERVGNWYQQFGSMVNLPRKYPSVRYMERKTEKQPSENQIDAIQGILSNPFSYIWGVPGTGKTQVVLAEAVISYVNAGKRVLVTAPTNNALEQTLNGLLPVMAEAGMNYNELVVRLGIPSSEFVEKYRGVCENLAEAKKLSELNDKILKLQKQICVKENLLKLYPDYLRFVKTKEGLQQFCSLLPGEFKFIQELYEKQEYSEGEITKLEGRISLDTKKLKELREKEHRHTEKIRLLTERLQKYNSKISMTIHAKKISSITEELTGFVAEEENVHDDIKALEEAVRNNKESVSIHQKSIEDCEDDRLEKMDEVIQAASFHEELYAKMKGFYLRFKEPEYAQLDLFLQKLQKQEEEKESLFSEIKDISEEELKESLDAARLILKDYLTLKESFNDEKSISKRIEKCKVVAVTVDGCLNRIYPNEEHGFSHVFLDEAGYCSLIKGCTLFAFGTPVTFLGDYMQLPPICEMDDTDFRQSGNRIGFLWAQSSLYAESVFRKPMNEVYDDYIFRKPALFEYTKKYDLIQTFRFGPKLASVLREEVYSKNFYGADSHETELYYIDGKKLQKDLPRTSENEAIAIQKYLDEHLEESIGIITPYKRQQNLLKKKTEKQKYYEDSIVTVHGSQGREWDTVLFSVVDTADMYFVNSLNKSSNGKKLINTAVSRARNRLIIVCDYEYWITQKKQFICKLLEEAKPYEIAL